MLRFIVASICHALFTPKLAPGIAPPAFPWSPRLAESEDRHEAMLAMARDNIVEGERPPEPPIVSPF